jgi:hypothetical protein
MATDSIVYKERLTVFMNTHPYLLIIPSSHGILHTIHTALYTEGMGGCSVIAYVSQW